MEKLGIVEARVEAANQSKKSGKPRYIVVDADGDCTVETKPPATLSNLAAVYRNGSEDKTAIEFTSEPVTTTEGKTKEPKVKKEKKMKAKKSAAKKATKPAAKKDRKAVAMPTGKKMKLTIAAALAKAKKGASLYRASNGSPLGAYYLSEYKNKEKEIEFIVKDAAK